MDYVDEFTDDDDDLTTTTAAPGDDVPWWRDGNAAGEEELDEEQAWHAVEEGFAAYAASGAMGLRLDLLDVLRPAKLTHVSWHTILNHHACARPDGRKLCHSVNSCWDFCRFGSMHMCRLALPNSYAPDDGMVVSAESVALSRREASEDVCMAVSYTHLTLPTTPYV